MLDAETPCWPHGRNGGGRTGFAVPAQRKTPFGSPGPPFTIGMGVQKRFLTKNFPLRSQRSPIGNCETNYRLTRSG